MSPTLRPIGRTAGPALTALSLTALLALTGCGQEAPPATAPLTAAAAPDAPGTSGPGMAPAAPGSQPADETAATPSAADPGPLSEEQMTDLLQLHAQLKTDLGGAYSDAWIEGGRLHVAVTAPEAETAVSEAGAIPFRAEFTEQQLREAADAFKAWLGTDSAPRVQLHWLSTSGRTGSINVRVPGEQVQPLADAVALQQPAGAVQVIVEESSGPATPLATNAP